ncbi:YIP1 family protein [Leeuwenhoekiella sp. NPDC079379]|uniref:YIP1 family protein n=1 Tax=Leeuwenhoekiella sp. NPDC079379 TaxID=3364122 RepID=UPI0037CB006B
MQQTNTPQESVENLTDRELFTRIWVFPREVFKFIEAKKYDEHVYVLLILAGIVRGFDRAIEKDLGDNLSLGAVLGFSIVGGALLGWVSYYIYASLLSYTGKWIGGRADSKGILRVLAYGSLPMILTLVFLVPQVGIYGIALFQAEGDITGGGMLENIAFWGSVLLETVLVIWSLVLIIIGISEVQQSSIATAILNLLLPIVIFILPILLIAGLFSVL